MRWRLETFLLVRHKILARLRNKPRVRHTEQRMKERRSYFFVGQRRKHRGETIYLLFFFTFACCAWCSFYYPLTHTGPPQTSHVTFVRARVISRSIFLIFASSAAVVSICTAGVVPTLQGSRPSSVMRQSLK